MVGGARRKAVCNAPLRDDVMWPSSPTYLKRRTFDNAKSRWRREMASVNSDEPLIRRKMSLKHRADGEEKDRRWRHNIMVFRPRFRWPQYWCHGLDLRE